MQRAHNYGNDHCRLESFAAHIADDYQKAVLWRGKELEKITAYLRRHAADGRFVVGCEGDEQMVGAVTEALGRNVAFFSSDFPHETTAERCMHELEEISERTGLTVGHVGYLLHHALKAMAVELERTEVAR